MFACTKFMQNPVHNTTNCTCSTSLLQKTIHSEHRETSEKPQAEQSPQLAAVRWQRCSTAQQRRAHMSCFISNKLFAYKDN